MESSTTLAPQTTWITVTVACKYDGKPHARVRGLKGTIISFKCGDRGCRIEQEFVIK